MVSLQAMKLFVFDIDGTITDDTLDEKGQWVVYPEVIRALNRLQEQGYPILFASGRNRNGIQIFSSRLAQPDACYASTANGASLYDPFGKVLAASYIPYSAFLTMRRYYGGHPNWTYLVYFKDGTPGFLGNANFAPIEGSSNHSPCLDLNGRDIDPATPLQKAFINTGKDNAYEIKVVPEMKDYQAYATSSSFFEFVAQGVSKAASASKLADLLSIPSSEVYSFGDGENDLEMVRRFHGTAMGNAIPSVKAVAEYVTESASRRGVAVALRDYWRFI